MKLILIKHFAAVGLFLFIACNGSEPRGAAEGPEVNMEEGSIRLKDSGIKLAGIGTDTVALRMMKDEYILTGELTVSSNALVLVQSRIMGRIEKLYHRKTGLKISAGEPLYDIYSQDLNLVIQELLLADRALRERAGDAGVQKLKEAAWHKLVLYGLTAGQLESLVRKGEAPPAVTILSPVSGTILSVDAQEGDYVMEGGALFRLAEMTGLWVQARYVADAGIQTDPGMKIHLTFPSLPGKEYESKVSLIGPELIPGSRIILIRAEITADDPGLIPGMLAHIRIVSEEKMRLTVPSESILTDESGSSVWVRGEDNKFFHRPVVTGLESEGFTEIKSGLRTGEKVVSRGAYLLNSEFIIQGGQSASESHGHHAH